MASCFTIVYSCIDILLFLSVIGILIYDLVLLTRFRDVVLGPLAGFAVFSIVVQFMTLISIEIGLRAFYIKSTMWIITSNALLCAAMCFTIIGATFFTILAGLTDNNDEGFKKIVSDIEVNFNLQVFNDCCLPDVLEVLPVGFALGDIVSDELCTFLEDNEADSFVGLDGDSCGRGGDADALENATLFVDDFETFTDLFFFTLVGILWFQAVMMLLFFLINCCLIDCSAPSDDEIEYKFQEVDVSHLDNSVVPVKNNRDVSMGPPPVSSNNGTSHNDDMALEVIDKKPVPPPLPPGKPKPLIPVNVRNYLGNLSAKFIPPRAAAGANSIFMGFNSANFRNSRNPNLDNGPTLPARAFPQFMQVLSQKFTRSKAPPPGLENSNRSRQQELQGGPRPPGQYNPEF